MTTTFTGSNQSVSVRAQDLIKSALTEINVISPGEPLPAIEAADGLEKLQRGIDQFNAQRSLISSISFLQFTLIPNHGPHTIGPGGDFNIPLRPVRIESGSFILNSTSSVPVDSPALKIKDHDWWAALPTKTLQSAITTHLYYDPASPLGNINFWPICTIANPVRLEIWNSLAQALSLNTILNYPQGYWEAMFCDLAIRLCSSYEREPSPILVQQYTRAMRIIEANNYEPPRMEIDAGMPNSRKGGRPDFNFLTGLRE